jgi:hypothetical protein
MNNHPTKYFGDLAEAKVLSKLIEKRWFVFSPILSSHCRTDLIAYKVKDDEHRLYRIQVKYNNCCKARTYSWSSKNMTGYYSSNDFDFYALYLPEIDEVCFIPIELCLKDDGSLTEIKIRYSLKESISSKFWWYGDFLTLSKKKRVKRSITDFGLKINTGATPKAKIAFPNGKLYPSAEKLQKLIWKYTYSQIGEKYSVSGNSIHKLALRLSLICPPTGFHLMSIQNKKNIKKEFFN